MTFHTEDGGIRFHRGVVFPLHVADDAPCSCCGDCPTREACVLPEKDTARETKWARIVGASVGIAGAIYITSLVLGHLGF